MGPRGTNAVHKRSSLFHLMTAYPNHHVLSGLQILEVLFLDSCHHLVVVQVLPHLHVIRVGLEEGVGGGHCFVQLVDLQTI